jgi:hypothetical protein
MHVTARPRARHTRIGTRVCLKADTLHASTRGTGQVCKSPSHAHACAQKDKRHSSTHAAVQLPSMQMKLGTCKLGTRPCPKKGTPRSSTCVAVVKHPQLGAYTIAHCQPTPVVPFYACSCLSWQPCCMCAQLHSHTLPSNRPRTLSHMHLPLLAALLPVISAAHLSTACFLPFLPALLLQLDRLRLPPPPPAPAIPLLELAVPVLCHAFI